MASDVEIANIALAAYGEPPILALDEDNDAARTLNTIFISNRDATLRAHPWNFATKRVTLAALATPPPFGFSTAFQLPNDFVRLIRVNESTEPIRYRMENQGNSRVILADADSIQLRYVAQVTQSILFDELFVQTFAARLSYASVLANTGRSELIAPLFQIYQDLLSEARSTDSMEDPSQELEARDFLDARTGAGSFRQIESL